MRLRLRAIGAACGAWALGVPGVRAQTLAPLVLHHIGPLTGVLAASNQEAIDGARLFLDAFNARGGLRGRAVRLQTLDDAQDPKRALEHFEALVASRQVLALLLPRTTPAMEALLPGVARYGVPVIGPQAGSSFVNRPPRREVFTLRASYQKEAEVAIRQQHATGMRRFGLLLADDAFGRDTLVGIERTFKELGIEADVTARIDNRKRDVTGPLQQMLAKRPQVVLLIVSSKAAADFVRGYRAAGGQATFISLSNTSTNEYIKALGDQAAGAIVMQVMPSPFVATTPLAREYAAAAARGQHAVSYAGLYGFATAKLATLALARAGTEPTRDSLIRALEGLGEVDLGGYRLRYGPGDRTGATYVDSTIITAQGRFRR
jgi:branched-chain amino acid transport system substrate-binding protein